MRTAAETFAFLELAAIWLLVALRYKALPILIPSPFNGGGDVHGLGPKNQLWLLLMLVTLFYLFVTAIPRLPLPINVPPGTSQGTIAEIRQQIPAVFLALKIGVVTFVFWIALLATQSSPLPHRRTVTLLLLVSVFAVTLTFAARIFVTMRSAAANPRPSHPIA